MSRIEGECAVVFTYGQYDVSADRDELGMRNWNFCPVA
jgi:hypothetical protein